LHEGKQDMVYGRIARRIRIKRLNSFSEYLLQLESDPGEWEEFVNSLTTNLTSFFREGYHFPILADYLREHGGRRIKLWCGAASTGEEPYSMAITAIQALGPNPAVEIVATDIDTKVLAEAEAAVYPYERVKRLAEDKLAFFLRGTGTNAGKVKVRPEVRNLVTFRKQNLLDQQWAVQGPFDVIFCRNVLIYFDRPTQRQLVERFSPLLSADGLLFIGHSETLANDRDLYTLRGQTVYEVRRHSNTKERNAHAA
jgi:chemotaxis protein methyltransferase CheR